MINDWYWENARDLCTPDKRVDCKLIRELCKTREGLVQQSKLFKRCLMSKEHETDKLEDDSPAPARSDTLSGYRSVWTHYIWVWDIPENEISGIPHEWDVTMYDFFKGLKSDEANRRQTGLLPCKEGKSKMNVTLFRMMEDYFHKEGDIVSVHNHNWSWNLMCRSSNLSYLFAQHLGWEGDCINCQYGQDKTRREGGGRNLTAMMKHLFVNPFEPRVRTPSTHIPSTYTLAALEFRTPTTHTPYSNHAYSVLQPHILRTPTTHTPGLHFCFSWTARRRKSYYIGLKRPTAV